MFQKLPKKGSSNRVAMFYRIVGTKKSFRIGKMELGLYLKESRTNIAISYIWNGKQMIIYVSSKRPPLTCSILYSFHRR